jgi:hypothetical protein
MNDEVEVKKETSEKVIHFKPDWPSSQELSSRLELMLFKAFGGKIYE